MSDARRYAVWPEPRSRSLKGSRPSVPHGTNFYIYPFAVCVSIGHCLVRWLSVRVCQCYHFRAVSYCQVVMLVPRIFHRASACLASRAWYCYTSSVCPTVCLFSAGTVSKWTVMSSQFLDTGRGIILVFFRPNHRYKIPRGVKILQISPIVAETVHARAIVTTEH